MLISFYQAVNNLPPLKFRISLSMELKLIFGAIKDRDEFKSRFNTAEACLKAIASSKWHSGFECKKCGHNHYCDGKSPFSRRCTKCKTDESATAHTMFHHCRMNIVDAFEMAYMICCNPEISSYELSRKKNTRQMTCWKFKKKLLDNLSE